MANEQKSVFSGYVQGFSELGYVNKLGGTQHSDVNPESKLGHLDCYATCVTGYSTGKYFRL